MFNTQFYFLRDDEDEKHRLAQKYKNDKKVPDGEIEHFHKKINIPHTES